MSQVAAPCSKGIRRYKEIDRNSMRLASGASIDHHVVLYSINGPIRFLKGAFEVGQTRYFVEL